MANHVTRRRNVVKELQAVRGQHFYASQEMGRWTDRAACRLELNLAEGRALRLVVE